MLLIILSIFLFKLNLLNKPKFVKLIKYYIETSGVLYIKFAQIASLLHEDFDKDIIEELKQLQASVKIEKIDFHVENLSYDPIPIASGSIAQVYKGTYNNNTVAIKVLRPSVVKDIKKLQRLQRFLRFINSKCKIFNSIVLRIIEIIDNVQTQVSFHKEIEYMEFFKQHFENDIIIPNVYKELCTEKVIVMQYIPDMSTIYDICDTDDAPLMVQSMVSIFIKMMYKLGVIHSDIHPGNLYWNKTQRKLVLLDFGIVFKFSQSMCRKMIEMNVNYYLDRHRQAADKYLQMLFKNYDIISKYEDYMNEMLTITQHTFQNSKLCFKMLRLISDANARNKHVMVELNDGISNFEICLMQFNQMVRILDPTSNILRMVLENSVDITLQNLGHNENKEEEEHVFYSI